MEYKGNWCGAYLWAAAGNPSRAGTQNIEAATGTACLQDTNPLKGSQKNPN